MKKSVFMILIILIGCNSKNENGVEASGTIEGTEIKLSSKISGTIENKIYNEGDNVKDGDTLIILDKTILEFQKQQAEAGVELTKAQFDMLQKGARIEEIVQVEESYNQALTNFKSTEEDFERMKSLFSQNSITKKQFDDSENRLKITKAQLSAAKQSLKKIKNFARPEELRSAEAKFEQSKSILNITLQQIKDAFIISKINGTITSLPYEKGELVTQGSVVATVVNLDKVFLNLYVPEISLGKINYKNNVDVSVDGFPDKKFNGKIIFISNVAEFTPKNIQTKEDRAKLVYAIKVEIKNENNILKSGMPADAFIYFNN